MAAGWTANIVRAGRQVLAMAAALHAGGWPIAAAQSVAVDADAVAACAPPVAVRGPVVAAAGAELTLADGTMVVSGLRFAGPDGFRGAIGHTIAVRAGGPPDRWGRLTAAALVTEDGRWLEAAAVEDGRAIVAIRPGASCARALLAREARARAAGLGLWADPANRPVAADDLGRLRRLEGRYTVVEGRISAVGGRRGTVYVNFGRRWSEDFTVLVAARDRRTFARAGLDLERLVGRTVRVRGHLELRGGPAIAAVAPDQIELLEAHR